MKVALIIGGVLLVLAVVAWYVSRNYALRTGEALGTAAADWTKGVISNAGSTARRALASAGGSASSADLPSGFGVQASDARLRDAQAAALDRAFAGSA